jgi:chorismate mutase
MGRSFGTRRPVITIIAKAIAIPVILAGVIIVRAFSEPQGGLCAARAIDYSRSMTVAPEPSSDSAEAPWRAELLALRDSIDNIDAALIHLLAERFKFTQRVGVLKADYALPPADPNREAEQIKRLRSLAETAKLDPHFAEKFLNFIVQEVIRHHEAIKRG